MSRRNPDVLVEADSNTRLSLLQRAKLNDAGAWREFVDLYGPLIAHWCRRCGLDAHAAADGMQETFASVATSLGQFTPTPETGSFRAWLWTITRRRVIDQLRRAARSPQPRGGSTNADALHAVIDPLTVPEDEPSGDIELRDLTSRALEQVRHEFEPRTWQAFWRSVVDGLPTDAVASELDVSEASVRQSRSRILRRLRQQLGDLV
jgi:RNA polymerase sigma-70 factor (ECF subfamily)